MKEPYMKGVVIRMAPHHVAQAVTSVRKCRWNGGKRELAIELRNHIFRESPLLKYGFGNRDQTVMTRADLSRRSRRPHASVDALCTRTGRARIVPADVAGRQGEVCDRTSCVYATGKSDIGNSTNEPVEHGWPTAVEMGEGSADD